MLGSSLKGMLYNPIPKFVKEGKLPVDIFLGDVLKRVKTNFVIALVHYPDFGKKRVAHPVLELCMRAIVADVAQH